MSSDNLPVTTAKADIAAEAMMQRRLSLADIPVMTEERDVRVLSPRPPAYEYLRSRKHKRQRRARIAASIAAALATLGMAVGCALEAKADEQPYHPNWTAIVARVNSESAAERCAKIGRPIMYAADAIDLVTTARAYSMGGIENTPSVRIFQGHNPRNLLGNVLATAAYDLVGAALTRRSAALRCGFEVWEINAHLAGTLQNLRTVHYYEERKP